MNLQMVAGNGWTWIKIDENGWRWMKMDERGWKWERRRSTDWWSCKAGQRGSMADASFCNGQYIPGSTPYPTPPEDTFSIFIFSLSSYFTKGKINFNLHICQWLFTLKSDHALWGCIWLNMIQMFQFKSWNCQLSKLLPPHSIQDPTYIHTYIWNLGQPIFPHRMIIIS